jgi:putative sigma-54 modulation protein
MIYSRGGVYTAGQKTEELIMRYIISGRNIDVTEGMKNAIYEKIGKLERYFTPSTEIHVTFSVEKKNRQRVEVTIPVKGTIVRAEEVDEDMYAAIDKVEDIIERQLRRYKTKLIDKTQSATSFSKTFIEEEVDDEEVKISKVKKFAMKPMDPEEACIQMSLLGHNFYMFRNASTDEVNVVYMRSDGTYGLIEPEI